MAAQEPAEVGEFMCRNTHYRAFIRDTIDLGDLTSLLTATELWEARNPEQPTVARSCSVGGHRQGAREAALTILAGAAGCWKDDVLLA